MHTLLDILRYIIETIGTIFLIFVILRFLLQLVRADFYNPFSQAIVKITTPFLKPLRTFIPGIFGIDMASIVLALLVQLIIGELIYLLYFQTFFNPAQLLGWAVLATLNLVTYIGIGCIIIMVISSFVAPYSSNPIIVLARQIIEPLTKPIQKLIPPMGGLDFSVMIVGMGIIIFQKILHGLAYAAQLNANLVIGY
jgi:YggT family protein